MTRIKILPDTPRPGRFEIELDGEPVTQAITAATLELRAGELPVLTLELVAIDVPGTEVGTGKVFIGGTTAELLTRAGWTPPAPTGEPVPGGLVYRYPVPLAADE